MMLTCPSMLPTEVNGHLTPREVQLAKLVGEALHNKAIGERLNLSEGTIKVYLSHLFQKLGIPQDRNARVIVARLVWEKIPNRTCLDCAYVGFARTVQAASANILAQDTLEGVA